MSWSHQEKEGDYQQHPHEASGKKTAAQLLAAVCGLSLLAVTFALAPKGNQTEHRRATTASESNTGAATQAAAVSDVTIGPVSCTGDMTPLQCESTGAFVFYTIKNLSQSPICKVVGSITYEKNGRTYGEGGGKILFSSLFDGEDQCISPGGSWRDEEGEYIANSNWAEGGYSSPRVAIESVSSESW